MKELKTGLNVYANVPWLFLVTVLVMLFRGALVQSSVFTQAGRVIPPSTSTPTPTPQGASPNQAAKRRLVIDRGADTYKLVFQPVETKGSRKRIDTEDVWRSWLNNFTEQLNKAGEQGYKLTSVLDRWQRYHNYYAAPIGILKLDDVLHEYTWFEMSGKGDVFSIADFEQKSSELLKRGFRLVDLFRFGESCHYDSFLEWDVCDKSDYLFLLEREKGVVKPEQSVLAYSSHHHSLRGKAAEMAAQIKEQLARGFYLGNLFWWNSEIFITETQDSGEPANGTSDVKVFWTEVTRKRVNDLAKQGYRLALIDNKMVVMYRDNKTVTPLTYRWLSVYDKHFGEKSTELRESGAIYRMADTDPFGYRNQLVFEQGSVAEGRRPEYRVLKLEFQVVDDTLKRGGENEVHIDLTASSEETMKLLNSLAKEGFVVRDLFVSDIVSSKVSVLLERLQ